MQQVVTKNGKARSPKKAERLLDKVMDVMDRQVPKMTQQEFNTARAKVRRIANRVRESS